MDIPAKVAALDLDTRAIVLFGWPEPSDRDSPDGLLIFPRATVAPIPAPLVRKPATDA